MIEGLFMIVSGSDLFSSYSMPSRVAKLDTINLLATNRDAHLAQNVLKESTKFFGKE